MRVRLLGVTLHGLPWARVSAAPSVSRDLLFFSRHLHVWELPVSITVMLLLYDFGSAIPVDGRGGLPRFFPSQRGRGEIACSCARV